MQTQSFALYKVKSPKMSKKIFQKCDTYLKMYEKNDYYDHLTAVVVGIGASLE